MGKFVSSICGATIGYITRTSEVFVDPLNTQCTMYNVQWQIGYQILCGMGSLQTNGP
jgi:hypothetical protein